MHVIPAHQEAKEDHEFQDGPDNSAKLCLEMNKKGLRM